MLNATPAVSVVIPTRNRTALLNDVLESLIRQSIDPETFEIIVVDNQSTDDTPEMVEAFGQSARCAVRYHRMETNSGPTRARNVGVGLARAPIIAFTDSDCRVHPEWLARALAAFDSDENVALVSGTVLDKPEQAVKFFTIKNGACPGENYTYPTCNAFYRKDAFLKLGGFDESAWLCDLAKSPIEWADTDLAWRVKEAGYKNFYSDDIIIYHEVAQANPSAWLLYPVRLLVTPELVKRHPELRRKLLFGSFFISPIHLLFYLAMIGLISALSVHWAFAALGVPYVVWAARVGGPKFSPARVPRVVARVALFGARHFVIFGSLVYGSLRARTVVL